MAELPFNASSLPPMPPLPVVNPHEAMLNLQHGLADSPVAHATVVIAAFFIFLSISFEIVRDLMRQSVPKLFQPILHALYSEMTNMGLAGIVIFLCGHAGNPPILAQISTALLGDPRLLLEQAERVHMLIFLFMLVLLVFVLGSLLYVFGLAKLWEITEKSVEKEHEFNTRERSFIRLRTRFVSTCDGADPDFWFYEYRKVCIMEDFCEVVDLHPVDWVVTSIILGFVWVLMTLAGEYSYVMFVLFLWSLCGFSLWQYKHLCRIRHLLHPPHIGKHASVSTKEYGTFTLMDSDVPAYTALPNPHLRGRVLMWVLGPVGDKHRSLFWPGANGPKWLRHGLRVRFLIVSITVAVMSTFYAQVLWRTHPFLLVISALPLGAAMVLLPITVSILADVTSIEGMKRENVVQQISHQQHLEKSVAILKSLVALSRLAQVKIGSKNTRGSLARNEKEEQFLRQLEELFDSIDTERSGRLDRSQFRDLIHYFYPSMIPGEAEVLFSRMVRATKANTVTFEEVAGLMLENFSKLSGQTKQSARDMANNLWALFDPDEKGSIIVDDVIATLNDMGANLDMQNITAFFNEVDSDRSGTLEKDEFIAFVHKHLL